jgi:hypothetical protein
VMRNATVLPRIVNDGVVGWRPFPRCCETLTKCGCPTFRGFRKVGGTNLKPCGSLTWGGVLLRKAKRSACRD